MMSNIYKKLTALLAVFAVALLAAPGAWAQLQWQEDFGDYAADSELYGQGSWMKFGATVTNPVAVTAETLEYEGYPGGVKGKSVKLAQADATSQKLFALFDESADTENRLYGITSGAVYYSLLLKVDAVDGNYKYITSFVRKSSATTEFADGKTASEIGKLFVSPGTDDSHYKLGVNPSTIPNATANAPEELECGKTYLVVVKYAINPDLDGLDDMALFVNPTDFVSEPAATVAFDKTNRNSYGIKKNYSGDVLGLQGITLVQSGSISSAGIEALVGSIRIADSWAGLFPTSASADWSWQWRENFGDYAADSELGGQGNWMKFGATTTNPIAVKDETLQYDGYPGGVSGKSARLAQADETSQKLFVLFNENADTENRLYGITSGAVYYSLLLKVNAVDGNYKYITSFVKKSSATTEFADGKTASEIGKLFVSPGTDDSHYKLGVNPSTIPTATANAPEELECGKTYLVVVKYAISPTLDGLDDMALFINPTDFVSEPAATVAFDKTGRISYGIKKNYSGDVLGLQGITLVQSGSISSTGIEALVGSVRLSDSWAGLFQTTGEDNSPKLTASPKANDLGNLLQGTSAEKVVTVKGKNLTGDITVSVPEGSEVSPSATTIPAEEAMSEAGYALTLTLNAQDPQKSSETITFSSEGADDATVALRWNTLPVTELATLAEFNSMDLSESPIVRFTGEAVISYAGTVEMDGVEIGGTISGNIYYLQDETGGVAFVDMYHQLTAAYEVGDLISGLVGGGSLGKYFNMEGNVLVPVDVQFGNVVSEGNTATPVPVTLADLAAAPADYINRLICVEGVTVKDVAEGATFDTATPLTLTDGINEVALKLFAQSPLVGKEVPAEAVDVIGISTSLSAPTVQPRSEEDIQSAVADYGTLNWYEDFEYRTGDLVGNDGWLQYGTVSDKPVQVNASNLEYPGYPGDVQGHSVEIVGNYSSSDPSQKVFKNFTTEPGISSGTIYYSALLNVKVPNEGNNQYLMTLVASSQELAAEKTGTEVAALFTNPGSSDNTYKIGVAREKNGLNRNGEFITPTYAETELETGKTYLVVVKYEIRPEGDKVSLFVDPASYKKEPATAATVYESKATLASGMAVRAIELRQTQTTSYKGVNAEVAALRISDTYAGLFKEIERLPSVEIDNLTFERAEGKVGETTEVGTMNISAKYLPTGIKLELQGTAADQFEISANSIGTGSSETALQISYKPTTIGVHTAYLTMDCEGQPDLLPTSMVKLTGIAIDPDNMPVVTLEPAELPAFEPTNIGETKEQTIVVKSANLAEYGKVAFKAASGNFRISNTIIMKETGEDGSILKVTFAPKAAGEQTDTILFSAYGMETIALELKGTGVDPNAVPEKEGDELPLDPSSPLTLLNETFDGGEHNKPLSIDGWKNLAIDGTRAWWGYEFPETDASAGEKVAKVTPYDSQVEAGEGTPCQMMLVTPALDYKNAASKMFTFRVRGDYLADGQSDLLELVYISAEGEELYIEPVQDILMPETADEAGEWMEYHVDLTGLDLEDVFFMGFRFTSTRGTDNAATYYIDDVTYGRTDLAVLRPSASEVTIAAEPGRDEVSEEIEVATENLTEPVTLALVGADKGKFTLSTTELPVSGGSFTVTFNNDEEGQYEVAVKISSRGAADRYVNVIATNITGISTAEVATAGVTVYDASGRKVLEDAALTPAQAVAKLPAGIYILKSGNTVRKIQVR